MKLYFSPATCSLAVHIALREAGASFDTSLVDLGTHRLADGSDYLRIQPRGYVPLLELDDGTRHSEVAALLQYVADLAPAGSLMPTDAREQFVVRQWLGFVATELHKVFSPWLWHKETADSTRKAVKEKIAARFTELEERFASRDYIAGDAFTVADAYAFTIIRWAPLLGIRLEPYPRLAAYLNRIGARPAVHAAMVAEGLVKA